MKLLAPQSVVEQQGEEGAIALSFQVVASGKPQEVPCLGIVERRRLALIVLHLRPADPFDRVVGHGVGVGQILELRREGGELAADRATGELAVLKVLAPREHVRASDEP